jgi:D-alanyl-lipoteichoic acid acyltransferase DltB (MBOAT superfamily)
MIDPAIFGVLIVFVVGIANALFSANYTVRFLAAVFPGFLILVYAAPAALILGFATLFLSIVLFAICRRAKNANIRNYLPYILLLALFFPDYANAIENGHILFLGSAFFIVRQFVTLKEGIKNSSAYSEFLLSEFLATFFFASLFTGPVFSGLIVHKQLKKHEESKHALGLFKLIEGFAFILPLSQFVNYLREHIILMSLNAEWLLAIYFEKFFLSPALTFVFVFTTFYGYSKIAEAVAHLLGFEVPENFNRPHKSINFSDFWQRWHRSMADFVMKYLYLPISIHLKAPKIGLMSAFIFMGLWHNLTIGYLVWGLAHSSALIWLQPIVASPKFPVALARIFTLLFVMYVSYLANYWLI